MRIVKETNWNVSKVIDEEGMIRGGLQWTPLGLQEFRIYLVVCLLMDITKFPSIRLY